MDEVSDFLLSVSAARPDGDIVDRLNWFYTVLILICSSTFIFAWEFVGEPIQCWFPAYYAGWWTEYALDYCYVQNTYFVPFSNGPTTNYWDLTANQVQIPENITHREDKLIGYYQWVPFVLALEALCFYMPVLLWRNLYESSGVKVKVICETLSDADNMEASNQLYSWTVLLGVFRIWTRLRTRCPLFVIISPNNPRIQNTLKYISTLYLFIKVLFAVNCIAQFFMLESFLGLENWWWGATVLNDVVAGREWHETEHFPRVRVLGNLHRHTVQCVLMINMFNEKIFVFLWWWFAVVTILSVVSAVYWIVTSIADRTGRNLISDYIDRSDPHTAGMSPKERERLVGEFMNESLKSDGIFLLRLIASNAGELVVCELVNNLWDRYKERRAMQPPPPRQTLGSPGFSSQDTLRAKDAYGRSPPAYDMPDEHS